MRDENMNLLFERYPKMFARKDHPGSWGGIYCGDGWFTLIDTLCSSIQSYLNNNKNVEQVVVEQIKEKFGDLRFYCEGGDETTFGMIWLAESMSMHICEACGNAGKIRGRSWYYTACDEHTNYGDKDE